jgi:hypothetical protein
MAAAGVTGPAALLAWIEERSEAVARHRVRMTAYHQH